MREAIESLPGDLRRIAEVAGVEAAMRIAREFRGTHIYVPTLDGLIKHLRDQHIRNDYDRGKSVRTIALKFGLTERGVRKILGRPSTDCNPLLLEILLNNQ
jgi:Mor family transcriptional regulator